MPEGLWSVVGLLSLGYVLLLFELFVPGGILGILGGLSMGYGCWLAFGIGQAWGLASVGLSLGVTAIGLTLFVRSRYARRLLLEKDDAIRIGKAADQGLAELLGREGRTLTVLRPSGTALFGEERVDVVADGVRIEKDAAVRVVEIEGMRVVVEPIDAVEEVEVDEESRLGR